MKVELDQYQQRQLQRTMETNNTRKFLLAREHMNFEVGDVLLKYSKRTDWQTKKETWVPESISSENKMSQRYVLIHKDEFGICYVKQLKVSTGKLGKDIYALTDYDYEHTRFEVDPEYAEKIFLDANYDIKDLHKKSLEARKVINKMNRKVGIKPQALSEYNKFFNGMQPGEKFYLTQDYNAKYVYEYELVSIAPVTIHQLDQTTDYRWKSFKDYHKNNPAAGIDENFTFKLKVKEGGRYDKDMYAFEFSRRMVFFKSFPAQEEKK